MWPSRALDHLAGATRELVRLGIVDGSELVFVAKAQGATRGLRYDPDMGLSVQLSCSAAGHAWLSTMSDEEALALVARQGFADPAHYGPKAPTTVKALLVYLRAARKRGYATISEVFAPAMAADGRTGDRARQDARGRHHRRAAGAAHRRAHGREGRRPACHGS